MDYQQHFQGIALNQMKQKGVAIYGAGKRGNALFDLLTDKGFEVKYVIDKIAGKKCGSSVSVRIEDIEKGCDCVCIISPKFA